MKLSQIGKIALPLALAGTLVAGVPLEALACTQVWMPDSLTAEKGVWYAGRAEDSYVRAAKIFGVEPRHDAGFIYQSNENGDGAEGDNFQWKAPTSTYRYTFVRDHGANGWEGMKNAYSAAGINEHGVSCSATLSIYPSTEAQTADPNVDSGIGEYNYVSVALGQSKTAREAVELLGRLIDEHGACSCDQIIISDNSESWMLSVVSGHQWVAFQLPEDQASLNPNMGSLWYKVNLNDAKTCIHSEDLVKLAEDNGFLKKFDDGTPDIGRTYSRTNEGNGQFSRYVIGRAYFDALGGLDYTIDGQGRITNVTDGSLFFTPGRSNWSTFDMIRSLAARADNVTGLKDGVASTVTGVGRQDSLESHMFEIKRGTDPQLATVEWLALNRDEFSVAVPVFGALVTEASWRYGSQDLDLSHQGDAYNRDSVALAKHAGEWDQYMPYVMMDLNTLANANRSTLAPGLRAYLDAVQNELIAQNDQVEAALLKAPKADRAALATKAHMVSTEQTWQKCYNVLQEARAYLKGDQAKPFQASDYNATTKGLVTPLAYASETLATPDKPTTPDKPVTPAATSIAKAKVSTAKAKYTYTGKALKPKVTVKVAGKTLKANTDYTVSYKANKNVGKATITVTGKGSYTGKVTKTFKIVPKKTGVSKLMKGKKSFTVKWKKQKAQATGYQIRFSTKKSMKSAKVKTVKSAKKTSLKVSKLKGNKKYYVQMRTYKKVKVGGKTTTYYSDWSKAKAVKTRK